MNKRIPGAVTFVSLAVAAMLPAGAANAGGGPGAACAPLANRFDVPGLWLGHFSGGNWALYPSGDRYVAWRNEYGCFTSARACRVWRAKLKRIYRRFEGYGTCLPLRGGGVPIRYVQKVIFTRY